MKRLKIYNTYVKQKRIFTLTIFTDEMPLKENIINLDKIIIVKTSDMKLCELFLVKQYEIRNKML